MKGGGAGGSRRRSCFPILQLITAWLGWSVYGALDALVLIPVAFVLAAALAALSWLFVEEPAQRLGHRRTRQAREPVVREEVEVAAHSLHGSVD